MKKKMTFPNLVMIMMTMILVETNPKGKPTSLLWGEAHRGERSGSKNHVERTEGRGKKKKGAMGAIS